MSNTAELVLGIILWLGSISFLFSLYGNKAKNKAQFTQETEEFERRILDLEQESQRLKYELQQQSKTQDATFQQLHPLLISYPTARAIIKNKPDLPAKNLVALFKPLDNLLANWGIETIGKPWEKVPYNPQLHQADSQDIEEGELVYIRFVGYRQGKRILSPAKVSLNLPGKDKK
jgi:molecular chaperone GrpE (heat shock protein)